MTKNDKIVINFKPRNINYFEMNPIVGNITFSLQYLYDFDINKADWDILRRDENELRLTIEKVG